MPAGHPWEVDEVVMQGLLLNALHKKKNGNEQGCTRAHKGISPDKSLPEKPCCDSCGQPVRLMVCGCDEEQQEHDKLESADKSGNHWCHKVGAQTCTLQYRDDCKSSTVAVTHQHLQLLCSAQATCT